MTKKRTKSKEMLTNHIITLCREGNGNKGIARLNLEKKKKKKYQTPEKYLPITSTCPSYQL